MRTTWTYRVTYDFTGGPTRRADQSAWEPDCYTGAGSASADVVLNAPLTEAAWPELGKALATDAGYSTGAVTSAVELTGGAQ